MSNSVNCGPGVWKLNTQHLKDQSFILMVTQFWKSWWAGKRAFFKLSVWWDAGKASLQKLICSFSRKKASTFQKCVSSLECPSFFLQRRAEEEDVAHMLADTKSKLEDAHGFMPRVHAMDVGFVPMFSGPKRVNPPRTIFITWNGGRVLISAIKTLGSVVATSFVLIARLLFEATCTKVVC